MKRIVLITSGDILASIASKKLFQVKETPDFEIVAVVDSNIPLKRAIKIARTGIKHGAFFYVLYVFIEGYGLKIANVVHYGLDLLGLKNSYIEGVFQRAKKKTIPTVRFGNVNSPEAIRTIQTYNPDLILCVRPVQILRENLIAACPRIINIHCTLLPRYRGIGGIFQTLLNNETELGCTAHVIDSEKVDAGPIVTRKKLPADQSSSLLKWTIRLWEDAQDLLLEAINREATGDCVQPDQDIYYSWPNKDDLQRFRSTNRRFVLLSDFWW